MGFRKEKYIGLQSKLWSHSALLQSMGSYSCLFLSLCSIAEEYLEETGNSKKLDILEAAIGCRERGLIDEEWTCSSVEILDFLTGAKWGRQELKALPEKVPDNMYTVEKWYNKRTGFTHFRRRWGDTLKESVTVKEGKLVCYYAFTHD